MCNLVQASEPQCPASRFRMGPSSSKSKLMSPPIPPPTAFDAGLIATERIFSTLNVEIDQQNRIKYDNTACYGHRQTDGGHLIAEEEAKICQVLHDMMTHISGGGGGETGSGDDTGGDGSGGRFGQECALGSGPNSARGTISSARSQLNALSSHRKSAEFPTTTNSEYLRYDDYPSHQTSIIVPRNTGSEVNDNINNYKTTTRTRKNVARHHHHRDREESPQDQRQQYQPQNNSGSGNNQFVDYYGQQQQQQQQLPEVSPQEHTYPLPMDKATSTSDVPVPFPIFGYSTPFHAQPHFQAPHNHQYATTQMHNTAPNNCGILAGNHNHQQPMIMPPIYILQTMPNQQMPVFLVQTQTSPSSGGQQGPIFLQPVQYHHQIPAQPPPPEEQPSSPVQHASFQQSQQFTTVKATRVETRTTVLNDPSPAASTQSDFSKYEYIKQLVSNDGQKPITKKQQSHTSAKLAQHQQTKKVRSTSKKRTILGHVINNNETELNSSHPEREMTFIVGPSPVESMHEIELLRNRGKTLQNFTSHRSTRKGESYSDTMLHRDRNTKPAASSTYQQQQPISDDHHHNDYVDLYGSDEDEQSFDQRHNINPDLLATPATSSHTITIKTNGKNQHGRPCISSRNEDDYELNRIDDILKNDKNNNNEEQSLPAYQNLSNSSILEAEPVRRRPPPRTARLPLRNSRVFQKKGVLKKPPPPQKKEPPKSSDDLKIHGLYPTTETLETWPYPDPGFMRDKKSVTDQQRDHESITEKSVQEGISLIEDGSSWERNVCGLRVISVQVQFQEAAVLERLPCLVSSIQKHIRASGSKLARQAILTLRDLFTVLGPHFDPFLAGMSERLFSKMANTNKFIKDDCEATLESMVEHCSHPKMITILENVARRHKHSAIRLVACKMITKFITFVGPNSALEDYAHLILPLLCCNLAERTGEIREEARNSLRLLVPNPDFDAFMRHNVSPQFIFAICEKLERIRDEVSNRPHRPLELRRKLSRNHSLFRFKWQNQQHKFGGSSSTNMM
ncbi:uncharacterized protein LOC118436351 [Folsomia candida]|uniref:uncharacterized protein LOC118436351 n=1 Tax=Folsomia candida TaxID=158441 RepID=UPI001604BE2E|nr:uncharacterized protein LOC118436351 [Folsomia candida]